MPGTSLKRAFVIAACALHLPPVAYILAGDMPALQAVVIVATAVSILFGAQALGLAGRSEVVRALNHVIGVVVGSFVLAQIAGAFPPPSLNTGSPFALMGTSLLAYVWFVPPASVAAGVAAFAVGLMAWAAAPSFRVRPLTLQARPVRLATGVLVDLTVFALLVAPWVGIGMYQTG